MHIYPAGMTMIWYLFFLPKLDSEVICKKILNCALQLRCSNGQCDDNLTLGLRKYLNNKRKQNILPVTLKLFVQDQNMFCQQKAVLGCCSTPPCHLHVTSFKINLNFNLKFPDNFFRLLGIILQTINLKFHTDQIVLKKLCKKVTT